MVTKLIKGTKYYKKVWSDFNSPIVTSNNSNGKISSVNLSNPYKFFDGNFSSANQLGFNGTAEYFQIFWELPVEVKLSEFKVWSNWESQNFSVKAIYIYGEVNGSWVLLGSRTGDGVEQLNGTIISLDDTKSFKNLKITMTSHTYYGGGISYWSWVKELSFSGIYLKSTDEITQSEYEANIDNPLYFKVEQVQVKNYMPVQKKYMKKVVIETPFVQPILSADGTMGGSGFAVTASSNYYGGIYSEYYKAFNDLNVLSTSYGYSKGWFAAGNQSFTFYTPKAIKVSSFDLYQGAYTGYFGYISGYISGSNDGSNWNQLTTFSGLTAGATTTKNTVTVNSQLEYKYFKITATSCAQHGTGLMKLGINATEQTITAVESTKDDYDYIEHRNYIEYRNYIIKGV